MSLAYLSQSIPPRFTTKTFPSVPTSTITAAPSIWVHSLVSQEVGVIFCDT